MKNQEVMKTLIEKLNKATIAYDEGNPIMFDWEWDCLFQELQELEKKEGIILSDSPTNSIVFNVQTELKKIKHNHKMLSLQKTKNISDVEKFIGNKDVIFMSKLDGLTCSLLYQNGELVRAETRGNGEIGEDVTHCAKIIPSIPNHIKTKEEVVIDGEIICTYDNFEKFKNDYKNPRNFAAGSIRLLDSKECYSRNLTFVAWELIKSDNKSNNFITNFHYLSDFGFLTVPFCCQDEKESIKEVIDFIKKTSKDFHSYPIDGVVIKYIDIEYGKSLGETAHHRNDALAFKFYDDEVETTLRDIEWTMGRTGILTPVAIFDKVEIDGTDVERASLHNINTLIDTLGIVPHENQPIYVVKQNQIIPQISSAQDKVIFIADIDESKEKYADIHLTTRDNFLDIYGTYKGNKILEVPKKCPICGADTVVIENDDTQILKCVNKDCMGQAINRFDHFCGKKGLEIKGLSKATLEKLIDWGWLNKLEDIFLLENHKKEWVQKSGFGDKSVSNILNAIEESKNCQLDKFISAIGIPLIGYNVAKEIVKNGILTYENFREKVNSKFDFSIFDTFAEAKTASILSFNYEEADAVFKYLNILKPNKEEKVVKSTAKKLSGLIFCITGKLKRGTRDVFKAEIESLGGKVVNSITGKTDYLINNDINSNSVKNKTAKAKNIPIITEDEFDNIFFDK